MKNMFTFFEYLNEIDFNINPTEYSITHHDGNKEVYEFLSNNENSYSVYFMLTEEDNEKLSNGKYLNQYIKLNKIPTIFFSLTERGFGENFEELSNKSEFLEVMGKVVFLILEYFRKHKHEYFVYSIGEVGDKKINFYNHYRKYFNDYNIVTGKSKNYIDNDTNKKMAYYFIKKEEIDYNEKLLKLDDNCYLKINK